MKKNGSPPVKKNNTLGGILTAGGSDNGNLRARERKMGGGTMG